DPQASPGNQCLAAGQCVCAHTFLPLCQTSLETASSTVASAADAAATTRHYPTPIPRAKCIIVFERRAQALPARNAYGNPHQSGPLPPVRAGGHPAPLAPKPG